MRTEGSSDQEAHENAEVAGRARRQTLPRTRTGAPESAGMAERAVRPPGEGARGKTAPAVPRDERGTRLLLQRGGRDSAARVPTAPGPGERTGRGLPGLPKGPKLGAGRRLVAGGGRAHPGDARTGGPAVPGTEQMIEDPLAPVTERMRGGPVVPGKKRKRSSSRTRRSRA